MDMAGFLRFWGGLCEFGNSGIQVGRKGGSAGLCLQKRGARQHPSPLQCCTESLMHTTSGYQR